MIDTNVLVSGVLDPHSSPGRIVDGALSRNLNVLHDDRILSEYREVLTRPLFGFEPVAIDTLLDFLELNGEHISVKDTRIVLPDPSDLPFLEVAIAGNADALITGNLKHFKPRRGTCNAHVCTPGEFVKRLLSQGSAFS